MQGSQSQLHDLLRGHPGTNARSHCRVGNKDCNLHFKSCAKTQWSAKRSCPSRCLQPRKAHAIVCLLLSDSNPQPPWTLPPPEHPSFSSQLPSSMPLVFTAQFNFQQAGASKCGRFPWWLPSLIVALQSKCTLITAREPSPFSLAINLSVTCNYWTCSWGRSMGNDIHHCDQVHTNFPLLSFASTSTLHRARLTFTASNPIKVPEGGQELINCTDSFPASHWKQYTSLYDDQNLGTISIYYTAIFKMQETWKACQLSPPN